MHLWSLKTIKMLRTRFEGVMDMILMATACGWSLHMEGVVIHLQEIDIVVTATVEVDVGYLGARNIVFWSLDCPLLLHGRILKITCERPGMFAFPKFSMMEEELLGLWITQTMMT